MFRQNTSSPKTWSLRCCKKWTWRRDASKFGGLILWVACSTKTLLLTRIKTFHIFPHTVASNVVFRQKYVLSEKRLPLSCHKNSSQIFDATKLWKHTIPLTYNTKTLISNISETHRFSPQMRLIAYPDHKTTHKSWHFLSHFQFSLSGDRFGWACKTGMIVYGRCPIYVFTKIIRFWLQPQWVEFCHEQHFNGDPKILVDHFQYFIIFYVLQVSFWKSCNCQKCPNPFWEPLM